MDLEQRASGRAPNLQSLFQEIFFSYENVLCQSSAFSCSLRFTQQVIPLSVSSSSSSPRPSGPVITAPGQNLSGVS